MIILIGLGNPGRKFINTRHNIGFDFIDYIKRVKGFSNWKENKRLFSLISEGVISNKKVILAKPLTFMNNSGIAVLKIKERYNANLENLWIVHDDLDLPLGTIRISFGKGFGGHNGVKSIIQHLQTKDFVRYRIGIKSNDLKINRKVFVLEKFNIKEKKIISKTKKAFLKTIELAIEKGLSQAMTETNKRKGSI